MCLELRYVVAVAAIAPWQRRQLKATPSFFYWNVTKHLSRRLSHESKMLTLTFVLWQILKGFRLLLCLFTYPLVVLLPIFNRLYYSWWRQMKKQLLWDVEVKYLAQQKYLLFTFLFCYFNLCPFFVEWTWTLLPLLKNQTIVRENCSVDLMVVFIWFHLTWTGVRLVWFIQLPIRCEVN